MSEFTETQALGELRAAYARMTPDQLARERAQLTIDIDRCRGRDAYMNTQLEALDEAIAGRAGRARHEDGDAPAST